MKSIVKVLVVATTLFFAANNVTSADKSFEPSVSGDGTCNSIESWFGWCRPH